MEGRCLGNGETENVRELGAKSPISGVARIFFGGGGTPGPFKGYHKPPAGDPGEAKAPRMVAKFNFLTMLSIRKWIHFSKISTSFIAKKSIFSKKNFEKLNRFYKNFWIFREIFLKFSIFMIHYKSREIPGEFYALVEKFIKMLKK